MSYYDCPQAKPGYITEPYHIPGYGGFIPTMRIRTGASFGRASRQVLEDPCVPQAPIPVLQAVYCPSNVALSSCDIQPCRQVTTPDTTDSGAIPASTPQCSSSPTVPQSPLPKTNSNCYLPIGAVTSSSKISPVCNNNNPTDPISCLPKTATNGSSPFGAVTSPSKTNACCYNPTDQLIPSLPKTNAGGDNAMGAVTSPSKTNDNCFNFMGAVTSPSKTNANCYNCMGPFTSPSKTNNANYCCRPTSARPSSSRTNDTCFNPVGMSTPSQLGLKACRDPQLIRPPSACLSTQDERPKTSACERLGTAVPGSGERCDSTSTADFPEFSPLNYPSHWPLPRLVTSESQTDQAPCTCPCPYGKAASQTKLNQESPCNDTTSGSEAARPCPRQGISSRNRADSEGARLCLTMSMKCCRPTSSSSSLAPAQRQPRPPCEPAFRKRSTSKCEIRNPVGCTDLGCCDNNNLCRKQEPRRNKVKSCDSEADLPCCNPRPNTPRSKPPPSASPQCQTQSQTQLQSKTISNRNQTAPARSRDGNPDIYRLCEGLPSSYAGHIPGYTFHSNGRTFAKATTATKQHMDNCISYKSCSP